jgi:hypothetical protein
LPSPGCGQGFAQRGVQDGVVVGDDEIEPEIKP